MLQLTKRAEYGLIALIHLVDRKDEFVSAREISDHYAIPRRLVAEVLKDLCRADLLESHRGATGGYALAREAGDIALGTVITALEGPVALTECGASADYHEGDCEVESLCPIRTPLHRMRSVIWNMMQRTSLKDLAGEHAFASISRPL